MNFSRQLIRCLTSRRWQEVSHSPDCSLSYAIDLVIVISLPRTNTISPCMLSTTHWKLQRDPTSYPSTAVVIRLKNPRGGLLAEAKCRLIIAFVDKVISDTLSHSTSGCTIFLFNLILLELVLLQYRALLSTPEVCVTSVSHELIIHIEHFWR